MKKALPVLCAILLLQILACEPPVVIKSKWTDSDIAFNADPGQWKEALEYPEDPQFGVGAKNSGKFLYLCMTSWKREINGRILRFGFTTWFSSPSMKGKRFGIHFPMGGMRNAAAWRHRPERNEEPGEARAGMAESFQEMELLGPEKSDSVPVRTSVAESFGIVVRMFPSEENLIYLMKVPLNSDSVNRYAMDIGKDTLFNVIFECVAPDGEHASISHGESPPPMDAGGMHGGAGMHGGGGMHGSGHEHASQEEPVEPFSAEFSIGLAKK